MGQPVPQSWISENRFYAMALIVSILAKGEKYQVTNRPLSGIAYTLAFLVFQKRQLEQRQVAIPPADTPVMTIVSPLQKSNSWSRQRNCSITLLYPLKQSCLSLQEMGSFLLPEYSLPSQYITQILVQSQNTGLSSRSVDRSPSLSKLRVGVAFLDEPRLPLVLLQQLSSVQATVKPSQNPPLLKQIMYLLRLAPEPRWQQRPVGDPSRQAAPRS